MGLIAGIRRNERPSIFATHALVSVMLVCLASLLVQVGQRLAPTWNGRYLVAVAFLAAVESFITKRSLKRASVFSSTWLTRRSIELIVMLVVLKATLYLLRDPSQFWRDLPTWRTDFLNHFFTGEYFVAVMFVILIWLIGGAFTDALLDLEGDADFIEEEARVGLRSDRPAARQQLARQFFTVGGIMLALVGLLRLDLQALQIGPPIARAGVVETLIYFVLGLALLGQSRFAVLRARWIWDRIPMQANVATPWLVYSLLLLVVLAVVAAFLPTIYSLDLLATLGYLVGLLAYALNFLFFAIVLLVGIIIRFVLSLFGQTQPAPTPAVPPPPLPALPAPLYAASPWPWFELLKSVFFWAVFIGVIAAAFVSYARQNRELFQAWGQAPILRWLLDRWGWLAARLRRASQRLAALPARLRRPQPIKPETHGDAWGFISLRRLSMRERVQFYYLALVRRGREHSLPRQPGQTPLEYAATLDAALPESQPEVAALTGSFNEARYSQHEISASQVGLVQRAWEQIKRTLRRGRP